MKFRLVDRITSWVPWRKITGIKTVSFEEYSLKEAFGDQPRLPEMLMLESVLQLGNWLVVLSSDYQMAGVAARITEVEFAGPLLPGQRLQIEVHLTRRHEDGIEMEGEGYVDGKRVIRGAGCLASLLPLQELHSPDNLRVLFSEIQELCEPRVA